MPQPQLNAGCGYAKACIRQQATPQSEGKICEHGSLLLTLSHAKAAGRYYDLHGSQRTCTVPKGLPSSQTAIRMVLRQEPQGHGLLFSSQVEQIMGS